MRTARVRVACRHDYSTRARQGTRLCEIAGSQPEGGKREESLTRPRDTTFRHILLQYAADCPEKRRFDLHMNRWVATTQSGTWLATGDAPSYSTLNTLCLVHLLSCGTMKLEPKLESR